MAKKYEHKRIEGFLNTIEDLIRLGYTVEIKKQALHFSLRLSIERNGYVYSRDSYLPLDDHFYEQKIVSCLRFMESQICANNCSKQLALRGDATPERDEPYLCSMCGTNVVSMEGDMCYICSH